MNSSQSAREKDQMKRPIVGIGFLVFAILGSSLSGAVHGQEKGQWRLFTNKDAMTDEVTNVAILSEKDIGTTSTACQLSVGKTKGRDLVALTLPLSLSGKGISVQWRIDESPMVEEQWTLSDKVIGTVDNKNLLKAMSTGKRLRIRFTGATTVLEYDVRGLEYYLPKLGIEIDK